ncbi:MAG: orotidine-5'-phosphate decarboxylase [Alteromonadaceae bacterium]|nr:orotidine-5'-phosphate decarboxylase [Alteromonadaceae bacterium]
MSDSKVIVALDYNDKNDALAFVGQIEPDLCKLKVGKEMFTLFGPDFVKHLVAKGFDVFLDLKFHDIPNTVAKACAAAAELGVWMVNVHASGGEKMMVAAKEALQPYGENRPKLIAVTVLTSMDAEQLSKTGIHVAPQLHVMHLANLTKAAGLDGVVCSAQEAEILKREISNEFCLVTPGIRPVGSAMGDQSRVMTPEQAVKAGVDYMVIGRPITQADDPLAALKQINASISD